LAVRNGLWISFDHWQAANGAVTTLARLHAGCGGDYTSLIMFVFYKDNREQVGALVASSGQAGKLESATQTYDIYIAQLTAMTSFDDIRRGT
jgi:hypothetical protein